MYKPTSKQKLVPALARMDKFGGPVGAVVNPALERDCALWKQKASAVLPMDQMQ